MGLSRLIQSYFPPPQSISFRHLAGKASCCELPGSVLHPVLPTPVSLPCPLSLSFSSRLPPLWPLGEGSGACSLQTCPFAASLDLLAGGASGALVPWPRETSSGVRARGPGFFFLYFLHFYLFTLNPYKGLAPVGAGAEVSE